MTQKNDNLNTIALIGLFLMFGPFIIQVVSAILGGNSIPQNLAKEDYIVIGYIGGYFFYTGLLMLLYVLIMKIMKGFTKKVQKP